MKSPTRGKALFYLFQKTLVLLCFIVCSEVLYAHPPAVTFTQHPSSRTVCENGNTFFSVIATGAGLLSFQWEISTNGGATWTTVSNGGNYSGANTSSLTVSGITASMHNNQYRCVVSDGTPLASNPATLRVNPLPTVQTDNVGVSICANGGGTLTAMDFPNLAYQWQVSTNLGATWTNVNDGGSYSGATTSALVINNAAALDGNLYRYIATNTTTGCAATSTGVDTLHVNYIVSSAVPPATTPTCPGSTNTLTVEASGNGTLAYQWKLYPSSANVTDNENYSGATTNALTISDLNVGVTRYTVTVTNNGACPVVFGPYTYQVRAATAINTQPQDRNICATGNAVFSVAVAGSGLSFRWQESTDGGNTWENVNNGGIYSGATSPNFTIAGVPVSMNNYNYRVLVNGSCENTISDTITLGVRSSGTWLGAVDTNWHVAGNWCGGVPVSTTDVLVPDWAPVMPTISDATGTAFFHSLAIEAAAKLTINGGQVDEAAYGSAFAIDGTVAYEAMTDQPIFPADHGSLETGGAGFKNLLTNIAIHHNLTLAGNAHLVTNEHILTMTAGSNPIIGPSFGGPVTSWIVTGNGGSGEGNTGLGGLRIEQIASGNGPVLFPVGPTATAYNPALLTNTGVSDHFTVAVNDQRIPGLVYESGIHRTWLIGEETPGGSMVSLDLRWGETEEQSFFQRNVTEIIRSDGTSIVETTDVAAANGANPYNRAGGAFTSLTLFSVASDVAVLSIRNPSLIRLRNSSGAMQVQLRPTMAVNGVSSLHIQSTTREHITLTVTDVAGRVRQQQSAAVSTGANTIPLITRNLSKGVYYLRVTGTKGFHTTIPFIVQ